MQINATIFGQAISFILFVLFCTKYIWPPIISTIEKRQKDISKAEKLSEKTKKELSIAKKNALKYVYQAKETAKKIINKANEDKSKIMEKVSLDAEIEKKKIISRAYKDIDIARNLMYQEVNKNIVQLVISVSEKIIENSINDKIHEDHIKKIISNL